MAAAGNVPPGGAMVRSRHLCHMKAWDIRDPSFMPLSKYPQIWPRLLISVGCALGPRSSIIYLAPPNRGDELLSGCETGLRAIVQPPNRIRHASRRRRLWRQTSIISTRRPAKRTPETPQRLTRYLNPRVFIVPIPCSAQKEFFSPMCDSDRLDDQCATN